MDLYVVISEKKNFAENEHAYVYITKHRYVIHKYYLLCESLVEHPTSKVRPLGSNNNISDRSEAKVTVNYGFATRRAKRA